MQVENSVHGICPDCNQPVLGGEGVTVDPAGQAWHADCRRVHNRKAAGGDTAKRGPGRPRKVEVEA